MNQGKVKGSVPKAIQARLAALRRALRAWLWLDGLAALCVAAVPLCVLSLAADHTFRMDRPQRALCLAVAAVVLGAAAWRRLLRPLSRRIHDDALGLAIERRHPELGQRLITALQLARQPHPHALGCSPGLAAATVEAAARAVAGLDFRDALDRRRRNWNAARVAGVACLFAAACAAFPGTMRLWFQRNVLLGNALWPQKTHLRILGTRDGTLACARGDDLTVHVQADPAGVVPSIVTMQFRFQGGASGREPMVMVGANRFRMTFRNVLEPLRLRAWGGDAETPWCQVRLAERPAVESLSLRYQPPAYIGTSPVQLPANIGPHPVPFGSTLAIEGVATKDLARATLAFGKSEPQPCKLAGPRRFRTTLAGPRLRDGAYALELLDTQGYTTRPPVRFSLKIVPDLKPVVRARLEGIGDLIVPQARIPIACKMTDDHAVVKAEIVATQHLEGSETPQPKRLAFGSPDLFGRKQVAARHCLEAQPLALPLGSHLTLRVEALDNDSVTGPKTGTSNTFSLRVVSEAELRASLLRREQEQRLEFERLLRDQRKLLADTRALLAELKDNDTPALSDDGRRLLAAAEKKQRLVGNRCIAIAERFGAILAEAENNRLEEASTTIRERLEARIIQPLRLLARRGVLQAADCLDLARNAASQPPAPGKPGRAALDAAAAEQQKIVGTMMNILKNMVKWEGYQEAVNLLRDVLKAQEGVNAETIREYRRRIEKIFDK